MIEKEIYFYTKEIEKHLNELRKNINLEKTNIEIINCISKIKKNVLDIQHRSIVLIKNRKEMELYKD